MYIFVSHSSANAQVAEHVCHLLEENGHKCFLAPRDIRTGHEYAEEIIAGIERSDAVLLLLSKEANTSPHVLREIERAVSKHITIMVYKLEEVELTRSLEYFLMMHQWVNAKPDVNYSEILKAVEALADRETGTCSGDGTDEEKVSESEKAKLSTPVKNAKKLPWGRLKLLVGLAVGLVALVGLCVGVGMWSRNVPVEVAPGEKNMLTLP